MRTFGRKGAEPVRKFLRSLGLAGVLAGAVLLSGCSLPKLSLNSEDLYSLPTLPVKYTELNTQLNAILDSGAEYAAPTSGANIQPVQLVDLDGDGREEAVAFFRNPAEEKPLKIYIYAAEEDSYRQSALIEGTGTGIYSIAYTDLDSDGYMELLVGWKATAELQVLEVYSPRPDGWLRWCAVIMSNIPPRIWTGTAVRAWWCSTPTARATAWPTITAGRRMEASPASPRPGCRLPWRS